MQKKQTFHAIPWRGNSQEMHRLFRRLSELSPRETRRNFPILRNEQIQHVYKKSQKIQSIYNFFFFKYIGER